MYLTVVLSDSVAQAMVAFAFFVLAQSFYRRR
jgi:hypothetical protein